MVFKGVRRGNYFGGPICRSEMSVKNVKSGKTLIKDESG